MNLGPYAAYIISAYVTGAIVLGGLTAWVLLDHRAQRRKLTDLEESGMKRRSDQPKSVSP